MKYRVLIVERAQRDVREIYDWLHARSPSGAEAWYAAWNSALDRLERHADEFAISAESPRRGRSIRDCFFKTRRGRNYRIVFTIVDEEVRIVHVLGPARPLPDDRS